MKQCGEKTMIPKIIHYCWFGEKHLPPEAVKCIESWKKYCPDYKIIQWNESNYNLKKMNMSTLLIKVKSGRF